MNNTQMMRIKTPALFYLFRRALGVFCLFFIYNDCVAQIEANGKEIVFSKGNQKIESGTIYISEGTYVYNFSKPKNLKKRKIKKPIQRLLSIKNKKNTGEKNSVKKLGEKPTSQYHYYSNDKNENLNSYHIKKNAFAGNFQEHHNKFFQKSTIWNSRYICSSLTSKVIIKTFEESAPLFFADFKVRPPPSIVLFQNTCIYFF